MSLQMSLDAITTKIRSALELCARNLATLEHDRIAFVGDITKFLRLCSQFYQKLSSSSSGNVPTKYSGWCFTWIGDKIKPSRIADHSFYLYTTARGDSTMQRYDETRWQCMPYTLWQNVPDVLAELERSVGQLLDAQDIMILLVEKDGDGLWISEASNQCSSNLSEADLLHLQHKKRRSLPKPQKPPLMVESRASASSQSVWNSRKSQRRGRYVDDLLTPFGVRPGVQSLPDSFPGEARYPMAGTPDVSQSFSGNVQLRRSGQHQINISHPGMKKATKHDSSRNPVVVGVFDVPSNTNTVPIPQPQGVEHTYFSNPSESQGYNPFTNGGDGGLDTCLLAITNSGHRATPTKAMSQFAAHIERYGKQRAAETEGSLNNRPALQSPSTFSPNHPNFPLEVLRRVAMRDNFRIHINRPDLSCAFVVCDIAQYDSPIVYASHGFKKLTGYARGEVIGRNCRFLQAPDGRIEPGVQRRYVDDYPIFTLKNQIAQQQDIQMTLINYKRGGQLFVNNLTLVPISWDDDKHRFYVGFLIDITELSSRASHIKPDESYVINSSQTHVLNDPQAHISTSVSDPSSTALVNHISNQSAESMNNTNCLANPPTSIPQSTPLAEQTTLLSMTSPEADSPWSERDGLPPPYALSPGVFHHTSRMGMLSPGIFGGV